ncbi:MAG TPA: hypothetical protein VFS33_08135 [Gemmatimonadales bacterium]|nr:hypothetical protein [Gemmatimonadales bacterium]
MNLPHPPTPRDAAAPGDTTDAPPVDYVQPLHRGWRLALRRSLPSASGSSATDPTYRLLLERDLERDATTAGATPGHAIDVHLLSPALSGSAMLHLLMGLQALAARVERDDLPGVRTA